MSVLRPLPSNPSLEFERKEAKLLLRRLRAGDADALERMRFRLSRTSDGASEEFKLADAQLVIAREYGFASWPKLVRYYEDVERQRKGVHIYRTHDAAQLESNARYQLRLHAAGTTWAIRGFAAYVPRFYGMPVDHVRREAPTEDEARLVVARQKGFASWELLINHASKERRLKASEWKTDPVRAAWQAMERGDLQALKQMATDYPALLHPAPADRADGGSLTRMALQVGHKHGRDLVQPVLEWLESEGCDLQAELNLQLCGHVNMDTETVKDLLDRGADPNWMLPSGIPVLEHALVAYWNGDAVDLLAAHVTPRKALWIFAGLGDIEGVKRCLDRNGRPTKDACRLRPRFAGVSPLPLPSLPEADDEELLLEAFFVALLNGRYSLCEYLVSRGCNVNSLVYGSPIISIAVGNARIPMVECLIRCGADLDLRGELPSKSAREIAADLVGNSYPAEWGIQVARLCGVDVDAILNAPTDPPVHDSGLTKALEFASDDALRLGQQEINEENLILGMVRAGGPGRHYTLQGTRIDVERLVADYKVRIDHGSSREAETMLPLGAGAQQALNIATEYAARERREHVRDLHLLWALTEQPQGIVGKLLERYGANVAQVHEQLGKGI